MLTPYSEMPSLVLGVADAQAYESTLQPAGALQQDFFNRESDASHSRLKYQ